MILVMKIIKKSFRLFKAVNCLPFLYPEKECNNADNIEWRKYLRTDDNKVSLYAMVLHLKVVFVRSKIRWRCLGG